MQCEYCGRALKPGEWQCPGCGAPVEQTKETKQDIEQESQAAKKQQAQKESEQRTTPNFNKYYENYKPVQDNGRPIHISAYGGFWVRAVAYWIDLIVCGAVFGALDGIIGADESIILILYACYYIVCESSICNGATLGKKVMGLKVVNADFEAISINQSIIRTLAKIVSWITMCFGFVMIMFSKRRQGLHDHISNTYVIKTRR